MPRNIRWDDSVKANVLNLVDALLSQADDELDDLELKAAVQGEWVTQNKLRVTGKEKRTRSKREQIVEVGTRKEHLLKLIKKAGKNLNLSQRKKESGSSQPERELEEVQTVLDCLRELGVLEEEKNSTKNKGYWKFTLTLKHQTATREENLEVVRQKWKEHPKTMSLPTSSTTPILETEKTIDWRNICRTMLEKQKQLTTNRLMRADEMLFDIDRIRVDLALVERKQTDKRSGDDNPALSQLYKPDYEETEKLEYNDFLTKVLKSEQSKKVAIIGEPGAGKTTLLQRIAFWILDNTDDVAIWIPLGNFPNPAPKFKDYLLNDWLEDAIVSLTPKIKAEFEELLMAGKVWLLLDGVDEMAAKSGSPLTAIANRIVGWCDRLRVVLTCRLNVWEANPYSLNGFQTYRTLEFSEEKVEEFIKACFQKNDPELGIQLQQALNQPGKERIKDLVRNPLRLMLLCSTWHLREGKLPDTKAELYQQFVEEVYRWQDKEKEVSTITPEERDQLNAKLKELALVAIDNETNRFRLRQKFIEGVFENSSLFQLALEVGWLNQVGVDAKNPNQRVYAFFHPTFQEYFAALAIEDWDFFLPHAHDNHNPKPVSERYRIFEPQWKEVILLWLGREEVAREEFIQALVEFEEGCKDFYKYQAFFLAASGIAEFRNCSLADEIVEQVVKCSFGYCNSEKQEWATFPETIEEEARATLSQTDSDRAVNKLVNLIETAENENTRRIAVRSLGKIGSVNERAIAALVRLLEATESESIRLSAASSLGKIALTKERAIAELIRILKTTDDESARLFAAHSLEEIDPGNEQAIAALARLLEVTKSENTRGIIAIILGNIGKGNKRAINKLIGLVKSATSVDTRLDAAMSLGRIDPGNELAINVLVFLSEWFLSIKNELFCRDVAYKLGLIGEGNERARDALVRILETTEDEETRSHAASSLWKIDPGNSKALNELVQLLETTEDENTRWNAASSLGEIEPGNEQALAELIRLVETTGDRHTRLGIAMSLKEILQNNQMPSVVSALQHCLADEVYETNFDLFSACYDLIWHCVQNMTYPAFYQAWHPQEAVGKTTTSDSQSLNQADLPQSLQSAIANDPQLSQIIYLICIDSSQIIDPDRPAAEIYDQMLDQNCPECDPVPETMPALKLYWNSLKRKSDKRVVLVFYASSTHTTSAKDTAMPCPYSETFLSDLSKFGDRICVVTNQPFDHIPLKFFTLSHAIEDVKEWIRTI